MRNIIIGFSVFSSLLLAMNISADELSPVGFIWHYPFVDAYTDMISESGSNAQNSRAAWAAIEPEHNKFDFSSIDKQIEVAQKNKQKLILIIEFNPFCRPAWAQKMVEEAGESAKDMYGNSSQYPSHRSSVYAQLQENFIKQLTAHIKEVDTAHVITHYQAGIEWWFPYNTRYSDLDINGFRQWLRRKYGSIDNLNAKWGASASSFDNAPYPLFEVADIWTKNRSAMSRLFELKYYYRQFILRSKPIDFRIIPHKRYIFSTCIKMENVEGRGVFLETAWHNKNGEIFASYRSPAYAGTSPLNEIRFICDAPEGAVQASLHIHLDGAGIASFASPRFMQEGDTHNFAPPLCDSSGSLCDSWTIDMPSGSNNVATKIVPSPTICEGGSVIADVPQGLHNPGYKNYDAVYYDWFAYWNDESANYINSLASMVKMYDNSRRLATFLTYSWALPAEWDYIQWANVTLDNVAANARDIDILGMQLPIAQGDPYRIAAGLDIARKYGKPMWDLDLMDFVAGTRIGKEAIAKASNIAIQHGATGLIYCNWHGATDFNFVPDIPISDINKMLTTNQVSMEIVKGMKPVAEGAIILPFLPSSPIDPGGAKNDVASFMGWYKILEKMHRTVDVITLFDLMRGVPLDHYQWMLIADCAFIPNDALSALKAYQVRGGRLLMGGRFGQFDETRGPLINTIDADLKLPDYGRKYAGTLLRDNHAGDTPPMMIWGDDDTPKRKRILQSARSGLIKYFKTNKFEQRFQIGDTQHDIRCTYMQGHNRECVYLVNMETRTASNIPISLQTNSKQGIEIYIDGVKQNVEYDMSEQQAKLVLPDFTDSCIIILKY